MKRTGQGSKRSAMLCGGGLLVGLCGCNVGSDVAGTDVRLSQAITAPKTDSDDGFFKAAAGCDDCRVVHSVAMNLPHSKIAARAAKVITPDGVDYSITMLGDHTVVSHDLLLKAEQAAAVAKFGKFSEELTTRLYSLSASDEIYVWIWLNVPFDHPIKEDLLKFPELASRRTVSVRAALERTATPIRALLAERGGQLIEDGSGTPLVRAKIAVTHLAALAALPDVGMIGTDAFPGKGTACGPTNTCTSWKGTLRLPDAHTYFSTGAGEKICVKEGGQPDSYLRLAYSGLASPTGYTDSHMRGTVGTIRNTDTVGAPYNSVAPNSSVYIGNWGGFTGVGGIDKWCQDNSVGYLNFSWSWSTGAPGGQTGDDWAFDWMAIHAPYILVVAASGNSGGYVDNRLYNGLVVGGVNDNETTTRTDDIYDPYTSYKNFTTSHNDYELPNVGAPSNGNSVTENYTHNASSAATPMVTGIAALAGARDHATFAPWPEMKRAVVMATATARAGAGSFTNLPFASDQHIGVGMVDAYQAAQLGESSAYRPPNVSSDIRGRFGRSVSFAADFDANRWMTSKWKAAIPGTGAQRLRVVIAWDASPSCDSAGKNCTGSVLDGDIDLYLYKKTSTDFNIPAGAYSCASVSFDSSYEVCDIAVTGGETYLIAPKKVSSSASSTYFGVAWYTYPG